MRRAARVDSNQSEIVADLRSYGASVATIHTVGKGVPDILCGFRGQTFVFEIKDPDKPPSARKLTSDEQKWHDEWRGQVSVILTAEDALKIMQDATLPQGHLIAL